MNIGNASEKRKLLKEEYPLNLLLAVRGGLEDKPTELTPDIILGIQYAVSTLNEREQLVIYRRYVERKTLRLIGEGIGVELERIRQNESEALRKLRTFNRNDENSANWIIHYLNPISYSLLKAEKENNRHVSINGMDYKIV